MSSTSRVELCGVAAALVICGADCAPVELDRAPLGEVALDSHSEPLQQEALGVAERAWFHYDDPNIALASYASVNVDGCSGMLIGPSIVMSAAHCGTPDEGQTFEVYRYVGADGRRQVDTFFCRPIMNTFPDSDLALWHCDGRPGDRFGWVELDSAEPRVGDEVYSVWTNPIVNTLPPTQDGVQHAMYSAGEVLRTNLLSWSGPGGGCNTFADEDMRVGLRSSIYAEGGASGSTVISTETHRIVGGPSTAGDSERKWGASIKGLLDYGYRAPQVTACLGAPYRCPDCVPTREERVPSGRLVELGLEPADFVGFLDKDDNGVFDVQEAVERAEGVHASGYRGGPILFDFGSARVRAQWTLSDVADFQGPAMTADTRTEAGEIQLATSPSIGGYVSSRTVSFMGVNQLGSEVGLRVCLGADCEVVTLDGTWRRHAVKLGRYGEDDRALRLYADQGGVLVLSELSVMERLPGFEYHHDRKLWVDVERNDQALVWPSSDSNFSFAGVVKHLRGADVQTERNLAHTAIPVDKGDLQRICVIVENSEREPVPPGWHGRMEVVEDGKTLAGAVFPVQEYGHMCTGPFRPKGHAVALSFGHAVSKDVDPDASEYAWMVYKTEVHLAGVVSWTEWLSMDTPTGTGDHERRSLLPSSEQVPCTTPRHVQCRRKSDGAPVYSTGEFVRYCDVEQGLLCLNQDQADGSCDDYEVRYACRLPFEGRLAHRHFDFGLCIDAGDGAHGSEVGLGACTEFSDVEESQEWGINAMDSNRFQLFNTGSGRCLASQPLGGGAGVAVFDCDPDDPRQQWAFNENLYGWVAGTLRNIAQDRCLATSVEGGVRGLVLRPCRPGSLDQANDDQNWVSQRSDGPFEAPSSLGPDTDAYCDTSRPLEFDEIFAGDWNGDDRDTLGIRRGAELLFDRDGDGVFDHSYLYGRGNGEDGYLFGDWDGDGQDEVAVRRRGNDVLMNYDEDGYHDLLQSYGRRDGSDTYLVGDWDGDGRDNLAVRRGSTWVMDTDYDGYHDLLHDFGTTSDIPMVGNWDGGETDNAAVLRGVEVIMDYNFDSTRDASQSYGRTTDTYLVGDWDGDGISDLAVVRGRDVLFSLDRDGQHDASTRLAPDCSE